jgi:hypothetical protein
METSKKKRKAELQDLKHRIELAAAQNELLQEQITTEKLKRELVDLTANQEPSVVVSTGKSTSKGTTEGTTVGTSESTTFTSTTQQEGDM